MLGVDGRTRLKNIECAKGFRGGHLRAPNVVEHAATQIDGSGVIEPVVLVDGAGGVIHLKGGVVDPKIRGSREAGRITHQGGAARDEDVARGVAVGEKGQGVRPGALESNGTRDSAGEVAVIRIQVLDKGRTCTARDGAATIEGRARVEEAGGLGGAIEVEGAAAQAEVVVEVKGVVAAVQTQGALVDDRLAAGDVAAHAGDGTGFGLEGQDAIASLDEGDVATGLSVATLEQAGHGGVVRGEPDGVDDERCAASSVGENTTADAGIARLGEDTTALDGEDVEWLHGDATTAFQRERVDPAGVNSCWSREETDVGVHRDRAGHHFRAGVERTEDTSGAICCGKGSSKPANRRINQGPGDDALVGRSGRTGLTGKREASTGGGDGGNTSSSGCSEAGAADEGGGTGG